MVLCAVHSRHMSNRASSTPTIPTCAAGTAPTVNAKLVDSVIGALGWEPDRVKLTSLPSAPGATRAWAISNLDAEEHGGGLLVRSASGDRRQLLSQITALKRFVADTEREAETVIVASGSGEAEFEQRADIVHIGQLLAAGQLRWLAVVDLQRIARRWASAHKFVEQVTGAGAALHVAALGRPLDPERDHLMLQATFVMAANEAKRVAERTRRARDRQRSRR